MALLATAIPLEPTSVRTRGGILFDPNDERWTIREAQGIARIDFSRLRGAATPKFVSGFRSTLVWYAENRSLRHLEKCSIGPSTFLSILAKPGKEAWKKSQN